MTRRTVTTSQTCFTHCTCMLPEGTTRTKRMVTFSPSARIRRVKNMPNSIVSRSVLWDDDVDITVRMTRDSGIIGLMNCSSSSLTDNEDVCTRGLEKRTIQGHHQRRETRRLALEAVLGEQERQEDNGLTIPEKIASIYALFTKEAQDEARRLAILDEEYVRNVDGYYSGQNEDACGCVMEKNHRPSPLRKRRKLPFSPDSRAIKETRPQTVVNHTPSMEPRREKTP